MEKGTKTVVEEQSSTMEIMKIARTSLGLPSTSSYTSVRDAFRVTRIAINVHRQRHPVCRNGFSFLFYYFFLIYILIYEF